MVATTLFVPGSILETVPSPLFATQTAPAPYAMPTGARPTGIELTDSVLGSIRDTAPWAVPVTQTAPPPTATPLGCRTTEITCPVGPYVGELKRATLLCSPF